MTFLCGLGALVQSFEFYGLFPTGKRQKVVSILSLLDGHPFRCGRRDVRIWSLDPLEGFLLV